jgi:hypothetical protein
MTGLAQAVLKASIDLEWSFTLNLGLQWPTQICSESMMSFGLLFAATNCTVVVLQGHLRSSID